MLNRRVFGDIFFLLFSIWAFTVVSCTDQRSTFTAVKRFDGSWSKDMPAMFDFTINTPQEEQDFLFALRHNDVYEFSNIFLFVEMQYPDGTSTRDTVQYELAYKDGRWKGIGLGPTKKILLQFKEKVSLKDIGPYKIIVLQGMRRNALQGIEDLSLIIEKSQRSHA